MLRRVPRDRRTRRTISGGVSLKRSGSAPRPPRTFFVRVAASSVSAYSWYLDSSGANPTVVVSMTVTIDSYNSKYSQSQTLRFYPRITVLPSP